MAGSKQHFIPQHHLRGFQASRSGKNVQVVVYRQGEEPYPSSTEGVAAKKHFYSKPSTDGTTTLDDLITKFERECFNPILDALRNAKNGEVERRQAATAVVHLTFRAAHLRGTFASFVREFIAQFSVVLQDPEATRAFAEVDSQLKDSHFAQEIAREFEALPFASLSLKDRALLEKLTRFRVRERFDESLRAGLPLLQERLTEMEQAFPASIDRGHLAALERTLVSEPRVAALMNLRWQVISLGGQQRFILPDCVAVAGKDEAIADLRPYVMTADAEVALLAMPISSTQVLIGSREVFDADPLLFNLEFARCSLDFIVSSKQDEHANGLAREIGSKIAAITKAEAKEGMAHPKVDSYQPQGYGSGDFQVHVQFHQGIARATEIEVAIRGLFADQCGAFEAEYLDSIVIAKDMSSAVSELRGRVLTPKESQEVAMGSVELIGTVDNARLHLLLPSEVVSFLLLPKNTRKHQVAAYFVKHSFGRLTYFGHWVRYISRVSSPDSLGPEESLGLEFVSRFGSHYFGAHIATLGAPPTVDLNNSIDVFTQVLSGTLMVLEAARKKVWLHRNVEELASEAFPAVEQLLITAATACGLHASKGTVLPVTSSAGDLLMRNGLWDWFRLFDRDLRQHFQTRGQWKSIGEAHGLAAHAHRILWQFGIFVFQSPEHQLGIDVWDDARLLGVTQALRT